MNWRESSLHLTPHARAVYELTAAIPSGRVSTYGVVAAVLESSSQAVGTALHHNPFAPHVPCHRILKTATNGAPSIGGFSGSTQGSGDCNIDRKVALLKSEGVGFDSSMRLADLSRLLGAADFPPELVASVRQRLSAAKTARAPSSSSLGKGASRAPSDPEEVAETAAKRARDFFSAAASSSSSVASSSKAPAAPLVGLSSATAVSSSKSPAKPGSGSGVRPTSSSGSGHRGAPPLPLAPSSLRLELSLQGATGAAVRAAARSGGLRGHTSGLAPGFAQANLVIVPKAHAYDFLLYCTRNPKPCPLLEVLEVGSYEARAMAAPGSDIRRDLPGYRVWRDGICCEEVADITHLWPDAPPAAAASAGASGRQKAVASSSSSGSGGLAAAPASPLSRTDWVAFLLGCSFSFEESLLRAGLPVRHLEQGGAAVAASPAAAASAPSAPSASSSSASPARSTAGGDPVSSSSSSSSAACPSNVPMYKTNIATAASGPFSGPLVVSMRPMRPAQAREAARVTAAFPRVHGAPVFAGPASSLGIADLSKPDYGDPVTVRDGEVPVFWACGVTPQAALIAAKLPVVITHSPGMMFVTDRLNEELRGDALLPRLPGNLLG